MSRAVGLGPLPRTELVKLTVALPVALKAELDRYAELHAKTWGEPVDAAGLVPHMLEAFIARDRAFRKARGSASRKTQVQITPPL